MVRSLTETLETTLVVDDTDTVLNLVVEILKTANFRVLRASSGAAVVVLAAGYFGKIDLLLSDVRMPEMSGPELGDALKTGKTRYPRDVHFRIYGRRPPGSQLRMGLH